MPSPRRRIRRRCRARRFDASYRWLVDWAAGARCAQPAERLPWTLGLTRSPDGGWGDFVRLHPNRELPLYAAQAPDGELGLTARPSSTTTCAPTTSAASPGCCATASRTGRSTVDDQLLELADAFEAALARGDRRRRRGTAPLAEALFRRATARWQRGTRAEQTAARRRFGAGADLRGHRPGEAGLDRRAVAGAAAGARRSRGA